MDQGQHKGPNGGVARTGASKGGNGDSRFEGWWHEKPPHTPSEQQPDYSDILPDEGPPIAPRLSLPLPIHEPATPDSETTTVEGWRPKLARRLRAMGEAVRVPDKQGIFIPLTFAGILLTMLVTLGGVFYRAGQIVQNQNTQENARLEMNRQWKEDLGELKENLEAVREIRTAVGSLDGRISTIEDSMGQFMKQSIEERATIKAEQDELRRNLQTQEREQRLFKDYTEGRISGLPYRPPSG